MSSTQKGLLWTLLVGVFLGAADLNLIAPGLSLISRAFALTPAFGAWAVTTYAIVYAVTLPLAGALADRYGRRASIVAGAAVFGLGSLLTGVSPSFGALLIGRGVQAVGAASLIPLASAEVGASFPKEQRGMLLGLLGMAYGAGAIVAPPLGGVLVAAAGWRWLFFATVPIAAAAVALGIVYLPQPQSREASPLDLIGAALTGLSVAALLLGFELLRRGALPMGAASLAFGLLLLPNLGLWERGAPGSIFGTVSLRQRLWAVYALGLLSAAVTALALFVPLYGLSALHLSEALSGTGLLPMAIAATLTSWYGGKLTDRIGAMPVLALGFLGMAVGAFAIPRLGGVPGMIVGLLLIGGGVGLTMGAPLQYLVLGLAPKSQTGIAVALLGVFRALGTAAGPILYGSFLPAFPSLFLAAAAVGLLGLVGALSLWGRRPGPNPA